MKAAGRIWVMDALEHSDADLIHKKENYLIYPGMLGESQRLPAKKF